MSTNRKVKLLKFVFGNIKMIYLKLVDGNWASWGSYDTCTVTCGGGTQQRTRTCTNPAPQYGGADCSGATTSSQSCNTNPCPSMKSKY